jgi:hypothetical protein
MNITFETKSGSIYEVNEEEKKIRRLSGTNQPTERQGQDGEWKVYESLCSSSFGLLKEEEPAVIVWGFDELGNNGSGILKTTVTSPIVFLGTAQ